MNFSFFPIRGLIFLMAASSFWPGESMAQKSQTDQFIRSQMKAYHIPAVSVAVIKEGKILFQKAYGEAVPEYHIPNTIRTSFQMASATKLISATAIMTLVQQGRLELKQRVRYYLPDLPASWDSMQVMDLLAHQSGIADLLALGYNFKSDRQALDSARALPLDFAPGTRTVYAGGDYAVVKILIEKITGLPFEKFLDESVLGPLGMRHTLFNHMQQDFIYRTYDVIPFAANVYKWIPGTQKQVIFSMMFPEWTYPAGGLFSSIEDLSRWVQALDRHELLNDTLTEKMWEPARRRDGSTAPFGVGWIVDKHHGEKATGHSGGPALTDIMRLPGRKLTVIVLTNQLELRPFLASRILDFYLSRP